MNDIVKASNSQDSVEWYLKQLGNWQQLTADEEKALAERIMKGDEEARHQLALANLRLVVHVAKSYQNRGLALMDLVNEGNVGLMKAVDRFDPSHEARFATYACFWIRQAIQRALATQVQFIRLPQGQLDRLKEIRKKDSEFQQEHGRLPSEEELADEVGMEGDMISRLKSCSVRPVSFDAPVGDDGETTFEELIADENSESPDEGADTGTFLNLLEEMMCQLTPRQRAVLSLRFGLNGLEDGSLEQAGKALGLSRERVRQLENKALKKLRELVVKKAGWATEAGPQPRMEFVFSSHRD